MEYFNVLNPPLRFTRVYPFSRKVSVAICEKILLSTSISPPGLLRTSNTKCGTCATESMKETMASSWVWLSSKVESPIYAVESFSIFVAYPSLYQFSIKNFVQSVV